MVIEILLTSTIWEEFLKYYQDNKLTAKDNFDDYYELVVKLLFVKK